MERVDPDDRSEVAPGRIPGLVDTIRFLAALGASDRAIAASLDVSRSWVATLRGRHAIVAGVRPLRRRVFDLEDVDEL